MHSVIYMDYYVALLIASYISSSSLFISSESRPAQRADIQRLRANIECDIKLPMLRFLYMYHIVTENIKETIKHLVINDYY